jgi:beta-lactamase regulating signal transducer with metallopeptidase domain
LDLGRREEIVKAALWFHPAVLWLIARVRLAREEVVDELTVLATAQRRAYIEALLVFADTPSQAPAQHSHAGGICSGAWC